MIRQAANKTSKPADPALLSANNILQRKEIKQTNYGVSLITTHNPLAKQADKFSLSNVESQFNHDFSKIPVRLTSHNRVQTKLKIGQPNDKYEQEADRVAEQVMRIPDSAIASPTGHSPSNNGNQFSAEKIQRACKACSEEEALIQTKTTAAVTPEVTPSINSGIQSLRGGGQPLSRTERNFFEPRFGADFSNVRVHNDTRAAGVAQSVNARAFTLGHNVVFGAGEYSPGSIAGRKLFAHELTHVIQQSWAPQPETINRTEIEVTERVDQPTISRLSASDCATDCGGKDGDGYPTGKYTLTIYADKEGTFLLLPATEKVGHSWIRLEDSIGNYWTYGFWPETGIDSSEIKADVNGCVHHPDTSHKPTTSRTFELTVDEFTKAKAKAIEVCINKPQYNLFGLQCTEFVKIILEEIGKGPTGGFGLIWESPNALESWLLTNSFTIGTSVTAASSAAEGNGVGSFGLDVSYNRQFYSALNNQLRFYWAARGEVNKPIKSLSSGFGVEFNPNVVWVPTPFASGSGILGDLSADPGRGDAAAGLSFSSGIRWNIDEIGVIGVEYNIVKDLVNKDSELQRLMFSAGLRF